MHEVLTSLKQHQTQKFLQNLINFEKHPKILQKPKLFGHCEKYIEISFYLLEVLKEKGVFRRWRDWFYWERSGRSKEKNAQILYIEKP